MSDCLDPNAYTEPKPPLDVVAEPEWPEIEVIRRKWRCVQAKGDLSGSVISNCCIPDKTGPYDSLVECIDKSVCVECGEPQPVSDRSYHDSVQDYKAVGTFSYDGYEKVAIVFSKRNFIPARFYNAGDIYQSGNSLEPSDSDKAKHTIIDAMYGNLETGIQAYDYTAPSHYVPRTVYQQTNKIVYIAYDRDTLQRVDGIQWRVSDRIRWEETVENHEYWYGLPDVVDSKGQIIGKRELFFEFNPYAQHYTDWDRIFSYQEWADFNNQSEVTLGTPQHSTVSYEAVPNENLVYKYQNTETWGAIERIFPFTAKQWLEMYNFKEDYVDPPGWVENGYPTFFRNSYRSLSVGATRAVPEKLLKTLSTYAGDANITGIYVSELGPERSRNQDITSGRYFFYNNWGVNDTHILRSERYEDQGYWGNGYPGLRMVLENKETGKITYLDMPVGMYGFPLSSPPFENHMVINPVRDNVYIGHPNRGLWNTQTPTSPWTRVLGLDGIYPLFLDPNDAWVASLDGEVLKRYIVVWVEEKRGWATLTVYQPEDTGYTRWDGDYLGGNGNYKWDTQSSIEYVLENLDNGTFDGFNNLRFSPTKGPASIALETIETIETGPSSLVLTDTSIKKGPVLIRAYIDPPVSGPSDILLESVSVVPAPTKGPKGIELVEVSTVQLPTTGPKGIQLVKETTTSVPTAGPAQISVGLDQQGYIDPEYSPSSVNVHFSTYDFNPDSSTWTSQEGTAVITFSNETSQINENYYPQDTSLHWSTYDFDSTSNTWTSQVGSGIITFE